MSWKHVKPLTPVVGIDDSPFNFGTNELIPLIGVVMKGPLHIDGILYDIIHVDAPSQIVTGAIIKMVAESPHFGQLRAILLNGLTFGGFGVVDLELLYCKIQIPVIVVVDRLPDFERIKDALLNHFNDGWDRWKVIEKAGSPLPINLAGRQIFIQFHGLAYETAKTLVQKTTKPQQTQPEPLRLAHMIATSVESIHRSRQDRTEK